MLSSTFYWCTQSTAHEMHGISACIFIESSYSWRRQVRLVCSFLQQIHIKTGSESLDCAFPVFLVCSAFWLLKFARDIIRRRRQLDCQLCSWRLRHSIFHASLFPFLAGQQDRRNDLSHPIHADNCLLDPEANECWKEPPAYTFRDYRYHQPLLQDKTFAKQLSKLHGN